MVNKWVDTSMRWVSNFILFGVAFFIGSLLISWVQAVADGDKPYWYIFNAHRNYIVLCKKMEVSTCGATVTECNDKSEHICKTNFTRQKEIQGWEKK